MADTTETQRINKQRDSRLYRIVLRDGSEFIIRGKDYRNIKSDYVKYTERVALGKGERVSQILTDLGYHTLVLGLTIGSIALIHLLLEALLGHDAKFFDLIPVRWAVDLAHFVAVGRFVWEIMRDFREEW